MPTTSVDGADLDCKGVVANRETARLSKQNTNTEIKHVKDGAAKSMMCSELEAVKRLVIALKGALDTARLALEKLAN